MGFHSENTNVTGQTSFIANGSAVSFFTSTTAGMFLVSSYIDITAHTGSVTVALNLNYTDTNGAQSVTGAQANNVGGFAGSSNVLYLPANTSISYWTSGSGTVTYDVHLNVTGLN